MAFLRVLWPEFCLVPLLLGLSCGTVGGNDEQENNFLPTSGAGPYEKPESDRDTSAEEPFVVFERGFSFNDPSALGYKDGRSGARLWFARATSSSSSLGYAELDSYEELPTFGPTEVMVADQSWEEGFIGAPSVFEKEDGSLIMYYQGGVAEVGIGRATSSDGTTWVKDSANPLIMGFAQPTVAVIPGGNGEMIIFAEKVGEEGIFRGDSNDGISWVMESSPSLLPRKDLTSSFDQVSVGKPFLLLRVTEAGRAHYGLFYQGENSTSEFSIGYVGSFDGLTWEHFMDLDPILAPGLSDEFSPSVILNMGQGILFFNQLSQGQMRIAVAFHP